MEILNNLLKQWERDYSNSNENPCAILKSIAEICEKCTQDYLKTDPDPFDDRHPSRCRPNCMLGTVLKTLFKQESFLERLVESYLLQRDDFELQTHAARLTLDILPAIELPVAFKLNDAIIPRLFEMVQESEEPVSSYATGLLAAVMLDVQEIAIENKNENVQLVPFLLEKLTRLKNEKCSADNSCPPSFKSSAQSSIIGTLDSDNQTDKCISLSSSLTTMTPPTSTTNKRNKVDESINVENDNEHFSTSVSGSNKRNNIDTSMSVETNDAHLSPPCETNRSSTVKRRRISSPMRSICKSDDGHLSTSNKRITVDASIKVENEDAHISSNQRKKVEASIAVGNEDDRLSPIRNTNPSPLMKRISSPGRSICPTNDAHISSSVSNKRMTVDATIDVENEDAHLSPPISASNQRNKVDESITVENEDAYLSPPRETNRSPVVTRRRISSPVRSIGVLSPNAAYSECSNSSWAENTIGSYQIYPLTPNVQIKFIFQYLTPMGDYQELLGRIFQYDALGLIKYFIDSRENHDVKIMFEALRFLASLLCHKKFALEFLNSGGLELLLQINRQSVAATGVSVCIYYLGYDEDAMDKICHFPRPLLRELVSYALYLLESSPHDSGRCQTTIFFSSTFNFKAILDLFDEQDGLRKLLNVIFLHDRFPDREQSDDEIFTKRQTVRQVCFALRRYYEAILIFELDPSASVPHKSVRINPSTIAEHIETMLAKRRRTWKPVDKLLKLEGVKLLTNMIANSFDWSFSGRFEIVRSALDVMAICSTICSFQLALTDPIDMAYRPASALSVILDIFDSEPDPEVQRSALRVIINCVCGPSSRQIENPPLPSSAAQTQAGTATKLDSTPTPTTSSTTATSTSSAKKKSNGRDILLKTWNAVRESNGIMVLLRLFTTTTPINDADSIRALACKALCGLARHDSIKQIIGKLPIFIDGQLQTLMKEPVLPDKIADHIKFAKYCSELIEIVTGMPMDLNCKYYTCLASLKKAEVVTGTDITYDKTDLLYLIYDHLLKEGYTKIAQDLKREAKLNMPVTRMLTDLHCIHASPKVSRQISTVKAANSVSTPIIGDKILPLNSGTKFSMMQSPVPGTSGITNDRSMTPSSSSIRDTQPPVASTSGVHNDRSIIASSTHSSRDTQPPVTPGSISLKKLRGQRLNQSQMKLNLQKSQQGLYQQSPVMKRFGSIFQPTSTTVSLDSIIVENLRYQHMSCTHPIATCPPFRLLEPHRCPEPLRRHHAPRNLTARLQKKEIFPPFGGMYGNKFDRKFIYSRFRPIRTFRDSDEDAGFSACAFSDQFLILGTIGGDITLHNVANGAQEANYNCHDADIKYIEASRDGKLLLTVGSYTQPAACLWSFTDMLDSLMSFEDDHHAEFSKLKQDKIINTNYQAAKLYDITTSQLVHTFIAPNASNKYSNNMATFNFTDELILNDGVLWDVRSTTAIHKFDKMNSNINGVFHPNGREIISSSVIWDMRTYKLLKTVPGLDQSTVTFNHSGEVIFSIFNSEKDSEDTNQSPYGTSFRTYDAHDYTNIATVDVKKNIFNIAVDPADNYLAIVEVQKGRDFISQSTESVCRLYEIGRNREDEEEGEDEDDDNESVDEDIDEDSFDGLDDGNEEMGLDFDDENEDEEDDDDDSNENRILRRIIYARRALEDHNIVEDDDDDDYEDIEDDEELSHGEDD